MEKLSGCRCTGHLARGGGQRKVRKMLTYELGVSILGKEGSGERSKPMNVKEMIEKVEEKIKDTEKRVKELSIAQTICRWQREVDGEDDGLTDWMISRLNGKVSGLRFTLGLLKEKE